MNITRKSILTARLTGALSALASYLLIGMFFDLLLLLGNHPVLCSVIGVSAAVWAWDSYARSRSDYILRMSILGAAGGMAAAGLAVLYPLF